MEATKLIITMTNRLRNEVRNISLSLMPIDKPMPMIGPISGEINMAPMMTAVELTFKPTEATMMAKKRIHTLTPLKTNALPMLLTVDS